MISVIEKKRRAIEELCRNYHASRLEIFGSAAEDDHFIPESSDIDFLVQFQPGLDLGPWMTGYFELREKLEALLGSKVDLIMESSLTNPYFIKEVNRTRKLLYEAQIA